MSSFRPPEKRKARSSLSPMTSRPPVRAWTMLSIPSRSAVPGATISSAFTSRGSWRDSSSSLSSSPVRGAIPTRFYRVSLGFFRDRAGISRHIATAPPESGERWRSGRARTLLGALASAQHAQRRAQRAHFRGDERVEPELARLRDAPLVVRDRAQLAGEAQLAEARERRGAVRGQSRPARRARDRQRDREVRPRLVGAHAADDVHEHVLGPERDAPVAREDRQ